MLVLSTRYTSPHYLEKRNAQILKTNRNPHIILTSTNKQDLKLKLEQSLDNTEAFLNSAGVLFFKRTSSMSLSPKLQPKF